MKKYAIITIVLLVTLLLSLLLWGRYGSAEKWPEPYDEETAAGGDVEPLSPGNFGTMNAYQFPCWAGQSFSLFTSSEYLVNKIILGNMWGKVTGNVTPSAWADAYFDSDGEGDCGWDHFAGIVRTGKYLEAYVEPVLAMDDTSTGYGYFTFKLMDVKMYTTTNCTGSYTSLTGSTATTNTYDNDGFTSPGAGITTWKQGDFDGYSSYRVPVIWISYAASGSYRSYSYKLRTEVCTNEYVPCPAENLDVDEDTGCFYVYWY
jgi:hypothetical protein